MPTWTVCSGSSTSRAITSCRAASCSRIGRQSPWPPSRSFRGARPARVEPCSLLGSKGERRMASGTVVVVGGTRGLGREVAQHYAASGRDVVVTGRDPAGAETCATEIGGSTRGIARYLGAPHAITDRRSGIVPVQDLVLAAIDTAANTVTDYDIAAAVR